MSHDPPDSPPPADAKAALEDQLIAEAMEPYRHKLTVAELAGMRLFLRAFVKTHSAMQSMIARKLETDAPRTPSQAATSVVRNKMDGASGVVAKEAVPEPRSTRPSPEGSSVVAKDPNRGGRKGATGG